MKKSGFLKKLKLLDIYPKHKEEAVQQSEAGAVVSIIGVLILVLLLFSEILEYANPERASVLTVSDHRGKKMSLNFRIAFSQLPCEALSIDVNDRLGTDRIAVSGSEVEKRIYRGDIEKARKSSIFSASNFLSKKWSYETNLWSSLVKDSAPFDKKECLSCYDGAFRQGQCCNNCWSLKTAYAAKGLNVDLALKHPQCQAALPEGCLLSAKLQVNMIQGGFHIAVGEPHTHGEHMPHHHDWPVHMRHLGFNTTHYISHLSFGDEYPGLVNPLDSYYFVSNEVGVQQYFLQVVPTVYENYHKNNFVETAQYSMTQFYNKINVRAEHVELPGIFFRYDISPLRISIIEESKPFSHLLTRLSAVIGGVWVVLGIVYSSVVSALGLVKAKKSE